MFNTDRPWNRCLYCLFWVGWALLMVWIGTAWAFGASLSPATKNIGVLITGTFTSGCLSLLLSCVVVQDIRSGETTWLTKTCVGGEPFRMKHDYAFHSASWRARPFAFLAVVATKLVIFVGCTAITLGLVGICCGGPGFYK
jgi:hypothetical protein